VLGEYLAEGAIAPIVMVRNGRYKFIHSSADPEQLFDLEQDPGETHNLATTAPAQTLTGWRARVERCWSLESLRAQVLESQRRRRLVYAALRTGRQTPWDWQPPADASREYVRNSKPLEELEATARFPRV
jgi:choline-sulfatase